MSFTRWRLSLRKTGGGVPVAMVVLALVVLPQTAPIASASSWRSLPVIRTLSARYGPIGGGESILITGLNFVHVNRVAFGNTVAPSFRVLSHTRLQVIVPQHAASRLYITVRTRYGVSRRAGASRFAFIGPPKLDSQSPPVSVGPIPTPIVPESWEGPNPSAECSREGIVGLDYCGATLEGLAPLPLPANWASLGDPQQGFVLMNLERIERGEIPIAGISTALDEDAAAGADAGDDPSVAPITDGVGGSIWSSGTFVQAGMSGWLYDDGPGGFNLDCSRNVTWGCFGHRDNILDYPANSGLAAGVADSPAGNSAAAILSDQYNDFDFLWATELSAGYPQGLPASFALTPPTVTAIRVLRSGEISITGANLDTGAAVYFSEVQGGHELNCRTPDTCTVVTPSNLAANTVYDIYVLNAAGLSTRTTADEYTTKPQL